METKHTPGPWRTDGLREATVFDANGSRVAYCREYEAAASPKKTLSEYLANARLIAAAPMLLLELEKAAQRIEDACRILEAQHVRLSPGYQYDLEMLREQGKQARAAIAKATGN